MFEINFEYWILYCLSVHFHDTENCIQAKLTHVSCLMILLSSDWSILHDLHSHWSESICQADKDSLPGLTSSWWIRSCQSEWRKDFLERFKCLLWVMLIRVEKGFFGDIQVSFCRRECVFIAAFVVNKILSVLKMLKVPWSGSWVGYPGTWPPLNFVFKYTRPGVTQSDENFFHNLFV